MKPVALCVLATMLIAAAAPVDLPGAMDAELKRSMAKLRLRGYEAPYFIAYAVRDEDNREIVARFGAVTAQTANRARRAFVQVRVGDYQLDDTSSEHDLGFDLGDDGWDPPTDAPLDDDGTALRGALWLLSDVKYKRALSAYAKKKGKRALSVVEDEALPSFSREPPVSDTDNDIPFAFDDARLAALCRRLSARFRADDLLDGIARVSAARLRRSYVSSEGSRVVTNRVIFSVHLEATTRAKDGMLVSHEKDFFGRVATDLPDDKTLDAAVTQLLAELRALRDAPVIDPYTGPALLMEEAAGVFFHETVGHRLEGERQNDEKEGRTFKGQVGHRVLPEFLSVIDDPTAGRAAGVALNGTYTVDDEGVRARAVVLVDNGVLKDYLKSRTPITGSLRSNGHGRAEGVADPMGRMGNLFVRSSRQFPVAELKRRLLDEVRRQGKPFGLIIRDITGGSTNTTNFGYQAFKGQPRLVYRVDAKTGAETLVRGVEMVGTPLATVNKILATSDTQGVFNGWCGAESGFVPVSTVAPAMLMSEIELQRTQKAAERPPILAPPWSR